MSVGTTDGGAGRGTVQRALARMYDRLGARVVLVNVAFAVAAGLLTGLVTIAWGARYGGLSASDVVLIASVGTPVALTAVLGALFASRDMFRTLLSWSGDGRTAARAPEVWRTAVRAPYVLTIRACGAAGAVMPPTAALVAPLLDEPLYSVFPMLAAGASSLFATGVFVAFGSELVYRPLIEDIAAHLPADFEPTAHSWRLRTKSLAPLPVVTFFAALTSGAYVSLVAPGPARLAIALAIALATVAVAGVVFLVVTRSVLDPLEELLAATRRVRGGDLSTPVPIVTADDLGQLAHSFNRMLAGLRERESLLEQNVELDSALKASLEDLRSHAEELRASRARVVAAADEERRSVERDLHDGAQQQLVLLGLKLGAARKLGERDPAAAVAMLESLHADTQRALDALRELAHGIYPALLENDGLPAALADAVRRAGIPATFDGNGARRYPPELEAAVYFCCLEALQNAAKHAGEGAHVTVALAEREDALTFEVADDGRGFDASGADAGAGIQNMTDRIGALGGTLRIESTPGRGTTVIGAIPLGDAARR